MMEAELRDRLKNCGTLPTLPTVAIQIVELCQLEETDVSEIAGVIRQDPALTARLLRTVNSAFYGLPRQIDTLDHAVALLGIDAVQTLALSFTLVRGLRRSDRDGFDLLSFWRRSLAAGIAGRSLSQWAQRQATTSKQLDRMRNKEVLFLAGLLQDIGMLALREVFPKMYEDLVAQSGGNHLRLIELEKNELGTDHAEVSGWLAERWNLPEVFEVSLRGSHDPEQAQITPELRPTVQIVALSSLFADIWVSEDPSAATAWSAESSKQLLDMEDSDIQDLLEGIAEALPELSTLFEINLGDPQEITTILEQARETLVAVSLKAAQNAGAANLTVQHLAIEKQQLQERSERDGLTGLYNRAYLDEALSREFKGVNKRGQPLSVVFCDIDHFKRINDTYGHQAGDRTLISMAQMLVSLVRQLDLVGRYGGEEFVLLLPETSSAEAHAVCERICQVVASKSHEIGQDESIQVTISLGHATQSGKQEFKTGEELLRAADHALYSAKESGRNRIVAYSTSSTQLAPTE